jgi:hypothetical protein
MNPLNDDAIQKIRAHDGCGSASPVYAPVAELVRDGPRDIGARSGLARLRMRI